MFKQMKINGNQAMLTFDDVDGGLVSKDGQPLTWFTIAGAGREICSRRGDDHQRTVVVSSPDVAWPVAVRFAWNEIAQPNLFNQAGLPAVPSAPTGLSGEIKFPSRTEAGWLNRVGWQMTELSSAVQRAFISARLHGDVSILKTKH